MKKALFTFLFILTFTVIYSQERINRPLPKVSETINSELTSAIGWRLQPSGQWMERENRIPRRVEEGGWSNLVDFHRTGLGTDNFIYFQFRDLYYCNNEYTILIKKRKAGGYKYPEIEEDWEESMALGFVVFDKNELAEALSEIEDNTINFITIKPLKISGIHYDKEETVLQKIEVVIAEKGFDKDTRDYVFRIAPYKEKDIVQFLFYDFEQRGDYRSYGLLTLLEWIHEEEKLKDIYYETSYENFNKFIKLP